MNDNGTRDLLLGIAKVLTAGCPVCHGTGYYTAGYGPNDTVLQPTCHRCGQLRDAVCKWAP